MTFICDVPLHIEDYVLVQNHDHRVRIFHEIIMIAFAFRNFQALFYDT